MSKLCKLITLIALFLCCLTSSALCQYSGGDGNETNPYQISDVNDWQHLMSTSADWNKSFILIADINLVDVNVTPVGNPTTSFTGIFDGNEHIISSVDINLPNADSVGLFGYINTGQVRNLRIEDVNIMGKEYVGSLVGLLSSGSIIACYTNGTLSGSSNIGGLVGYQTGSSKIENSYSNTIVTATSSYIGGLVGANFGTIQACCSAGSVRGASKIGGLVGYQYDTSSRIENSYSNASIIAVSSYAGGLIGYLGSGNITSSYSSGSVTANSYPGGFAGYNSGNIISCFWDIQTSGQTSSASANGLTTAQMKSITTYQNAGWANKGWNINDGNDYPHLQWESVPGIPIPFDVVPLTGTGTADDPYQIWTTDDFAQLNNHVAILDKHIKLMADLDFNDVTIYPVGQLGYFTGVFDGNDKIINNASIDQPGINYVGLFGYVGAGAQIKNLRLENVTINAASYSGALVGYLSDSSSLIENCSVSGKITGTSYLGGLVGYNLGNISNCHVDATIKGSSSLGGLAGYNKNGIITDSNVYADITGTSDAIGGLAGCNITGTLTNCSAVGTASGIYNIGGLIGFNLAGNITNCSADTIVTGTVYSSSAGVGGLIGKNDSGNVTNCHASGAVTGNCFTGGLIGFNKTATNSQTTIFAKIIDSYATGKVVLAAKTTSNNIAVGFDRN